jgi:hypothetical protein
MPPYGRAGALSLGACMMQRGYLLMWFWCAFLPWKSRHRTHGKEQFFEAAISFLLVGAAENRRHNFTQKNLQQTKNNKMNGCK